MGLWLGPLLLAVVGLLLPMPGLAQSAVNDSPSARGTDPAIQWVVAQLLFADQAQFSRVAGSLDVWEVRHADDGTVAVVAYVAGPTLDMLRADGVRVSVDLRQTQRIRTDAARNVAAAADTAGIPNFACYRTVEETYADLARLAALHPELATWKDVGDSWRKVTSAGMSGYDLQALVLTNRAIPGPKPPLIIIAAIHAREYVTAELATRFAELLVAGYGVDADITWLLDYHELHIIPQANPDGRKQAEQGLLWRKNVNDDEGCFSPQDVGVDLNRNFSFQWNACDGLSCSSSAPCNLTYRGRAPGSEPETQALQAYVTALLADRRPDDLVTPAPADTMGIFLTLHSYSELVLFPWGWSGNPSPNFEALQTLGRKFGYFNGYQVCQAGAPSCLYQTDGTTDDWTYGALGVASYTFELGTWFFESCESFEEDILETNLAALLYAFKAARLPYQTPAGPEVVALDLAELTPSDPLQGGTIRQLVVQADDSRFAGNARFTPGEPVQTIAAARYTIDAPSWITGTVAYPIAPVESVGATATMTTTLDTSGLTLGRHTLFVEAQDSDGQWGVPSAIFVDVDSSYRFAVTAAPPLMGAPGERLTHTVTITNHGNITDTYVATLAAPVETDWGVDVSPLAPLVPPGGATDLLVAVTVPQAAHLGDTLVINIAITSTRDARQAHATTLITRVGRHHYFLPWLPAD